jgi:hypothetical protein
LGLFAIAIYVEPLWYGGIIGGRMVVGLPFEIEKFSAVPPHNELLQMYSNAPVLKAFAVASHISSLHL